MNRSLCQYPRLSQALQFPQYGVGHQPTQRSSFAIDLQTAEFPGGSTREGLGTKLGALALDLISQGLELMTKPLQMIGGKMFTDQRVRANW